MLINIPCHHYGCCHSFIPVCPFVCGVWCMTYPFHGILSSVCLYGVLHSVCLYSVLEKTMINEFIFCGIKLTSEPLLKKNVCKVWIQYLVIFIYTYFLFILSIYLYILIMWIINVVLHTVFIIYNTIMPHDNHLLYILTSNNITFCEHVWMYVWKTKLFCVYKHII